MAKRQEAYYPHPHEQRQGQEGYIRYLIGLTMLHNPQQLQPIHGRDPEKDIEGIIATAEGLMLVGLQTVIRFANPKEMRSYLNRLEQRFSYALPHMQTTVETTFEKHLERVDALNESFKIFRPAPMTDEVLYKRICHGGKDKIRVERLLDDFPVPPEVAPLIENRTLATEPAVRLIQGDVS